MDLKKDAPFSLYNRNGLYTLIIRHYHQLPLLTRQNGRIQIIDSLVCSGSYVRGSRIESTGAFPL